MPKYTYDRATMTLKETEGGPGAGPSDSTLVKVSGEHLETLLAFAKEEKIDLSETRARNEYIRACVSAALDLFVAQRVKKVEGKTTPVTQTKVGTTSAPAGPAPTLGAKTPASTQAPKSASTPSTPSTGKPVEKPVEQKQAGNPVGNVGKSPDKNQPDKAKK